jgi:hypothetical protein
MYQFSILDTAIITSWPCAPSVGCVSRSRPDLGPHRCAPKHHRRWPGRGVTSGFLRCSPPPSASSAQGCVRSFPKSNLFRPKPAGIRRGSAVAASLQSRDQQPPFLCPSRLMCRRICFLPLFVSFQYCSRPLFFGNPGAIIGRRRLVAKLPPLSSGTFSEGQFIFRPVINQWCSLLLIHLADIPAELDVYKPVVFIIRERHGTIQPDSIN